MTTTPAQARTMVGTAILRIVPDADVDGVSPDADLRQTFDLDSLDFLSFVELLTQQSGVRIEEDDYPELATMARTQAFLARRSG